MPQIRREPKVIGVKYDPSLQSYKYVHQQIRTWVLPVGTASVNLFDKIFETLFEQVVSLPTDASSANQMAAVVMVIKPQIEQFSLDFPQYPMLYGNYTAKIAYHFSLTTPEDVLITSWTIRGTGTQEATWNLTSDAAIRKATETAMRDAAYAFVKEFQTRPEVQDWLADKTLPSPGPPAPERDSAPHAVMTVLSKDTATQANSQAWQDLRSEQPLQTQFASGGFPGKATIQAGRSSLELSIINDSYSLNFSPNNTLMTRIGLQYENYGISYGFGGSGKYDETRDVSTRSMDFQSFYYFDRFGMDLYYQDYKGYYIDELPNTQEGLYPELQLQTYTVNGYYKLGGSNTLKAFYTPIPSARTFSSLFYLMGSVSDRSFKSDKPIIPTSFQDKFPELVDLRSFHARAYSLSAGVMVNMQSGKFFFNPGISVGYGYPVVFSDNGIKPSSAIKVNLKLNTGYEEERLILGLQGINDSDAFYITDSTAFLFHSLLVNFYASYKF